MEAKRTRKASTGGAQAPVVRVEAGAQDPDRGEALPAARSVAISANGVRTGEEFANLMSALMCDVLDGRVNPVVANAAVNAGGKLLKVVEMQYRYGRTETRPQNDQPSLLLATGG